MVELSTCLLRSHSGISVKWTPLVHGKSVRFIESPSKNWKSAKLSMKSTICNDFSSPDLLEGPKDGKIKENAKFFSFKCLQTGFTTLVHLTADHKVHIIYNQWIGSHFCWKCKKKIMDSAEKRTKSCAK